MNTAANHFIARNTIFAWIALAACSLLLIPLGAMQFTPAVNWGVTDFAVMGVLLFAAGSAFIFAARKVPRRYWFAVGVLVVAAFVYVWVELAVGVFTNLGS